MKNLYAMNKLESLMHSVYRNKMSGSVQQKLSLTMFIALFVLNMTLNGQVLIDGTPSTGFANLNSQSTITVSHTTGSASNRLMLVGVSYREDQTISVTYGVDALTLVGEEASSNNARTAIFSLLDPPTGTANVVVTATGDFDQGGVVGVMTFSGVDLNTPLNTYASSVGNSTNPTLNAIPSASNQLVFNVVALQNTNLTGVGGSQALQWNIESGDDIRGGGSTKTGASPTTSMNWTSASGQWSMSAVSIRPIPVSNLGITKVVNNSTPFIGQSVTFTLTANNAGPDNAPNVTVLDQLPSGYNYQSHSTATGTYTTGTGVWDIGTLNSGASATLTITATVLGSGSYTNTATISGDVLDGTNGNNTASSNITICQAGGQRPLFNN